MDDEDSLNHVSDLLLGDNPVTLSVSQQGVLNIWIDDNGDGVWRQVIRDQPVNAGENSVTINVTKANYSDAALVRVRFCSMVDMCNEPTDQAQGSPAENGEVEDYYFPIIAITTLSGYVFNDNGIDGGTTAHNGIKNTNESGLTHYIVDLYRDDVLFATTRSDGAGYYQFDLEGRLTDQAFTIKVLPQSNTIAISEATGVNFPSNSIVTDSEIPLNVSSGDQIKNINFGKIYQPLLTANTQQNGNQGGTLYIPHVYTNFSPANVTFSMNKTSSEQNFVTTLYHDSNCNGKLEGTEVEVPVAVLIDNQEYCLISKVDLSNDIHLADEVHYQIAALSDFLDGSGTGHSQSDNKSNQDRINIAGTTGSGLVTLRKTVKNITQNGIETTDNSGKSGDVLEYRLYFENGTSEFIKDLNIYDYVPEFSQLEGGASCDDPYTPTTDNVPDTLSCRVIPASVTTGYQGQLEWIIGGRIEAGEKGYVVFRVRIDN
ncbi:GEVED domain-containing protein [Vibrio sp. SS-MA-C1-2]|nr:GEVED domain-containing protein [Vibrio sp. SS-MA-C1-2]